MDRRVHTALENTQFMTCYVGPLQDA